MTTFFVLCSIATFFLGELAFMGGFTNAFSLDKDISGKRLQAKMSAFLSACLYVWAYVKGVRFCDQGDLLFAMTVAIIAIYMILRNYFTQPFIDEKI